VLREVHDGVPCEGEGRESMSTIGEADSKVNSGEWRREGGEDDGP